jgi:hypothetical protein
MAANNRADKAAQPVGASSNKSLPGWQAVQRRILLAAIFLDAEHGFGQKGPVLSLFPLNRKPVWSNEIGRRR